MYPLNAHDLQLIFQTCKPIYGSDRKNNNIKWIPVLKYDSTYKMGIAENGYWICEEPHGLWILNSVERCLRIIKILEIPADHIQWDIKLFQEGLLGDQSFLGKSFPFKEITMAGFLQCSGYWAVLAFSWYHELEEEEKYLFLKLFQSLQQEKWASQSLRHQATKEARRLQRKGLEEQ